MGGVEILLTCVLCPHCHDLYQTTQLPTYHYVYLYIMIEDIHCFAFIHIEYEMKLYKRERV